MRLHMIMLAAVAVLSGCSDRDDVYTLYRTSSVQPDYRMHMATFDVKGGGSSNGENCRIAAELFTRNMFALNGGRNPGTRFWCETGHFRA